MPNGQHLRQKSKIAEKERDREKIGGRELQRRAAEAMRKRVKISHPGTSYPCNFGRPEGNQDRVADRSEDAPLPRRRAPVPAPVLCAACWEDCLG